MAYAGLSGLWAMVVTLRVGVVRQRQKVFIGDGGDDSGLRAVRVHGNNMD